MSDEEHLDIDQCDKDEPGESKSAKAAVKAAAGKVAKKADEKAAEKAAHDKAVADVKAKLTTEEKAILLADYMAQQPTPSPLSRRSDYDHETKQKNLVKNTAPVRALMETLKDDYECVHFMGSLCDYWKTLMPLDHAQKNEHTCFINYFKKERHLYGLPLFMPASPGSKNVSRGVTPGINEDEEDVAGAK